jgi:hypothetical protein
MTTKDVPMRRGGQVGRGDHLTEELGDALQENCISPDRQEIARRYAAGWQTNPDESSVYDEEPITA